MIQPTLFHQVKTIPYNFKSFTACLFKIQPFSISLYPTLTPLSVLRYNQFPISFCTSVLASPDKAQLLMRVKQFLLGMESIRLTLVKIHLRFSCCTPIVFLTFLLSCLSFLGMPQLLSQLVIWL